MIRGQRRHAYAGLNNIVDQREKLPLSAASKIRVMASNAKNRVYCWDVDGVLIRYDPFQPANDWRKKLIDDGLLDVWEAFQDSPLWLQCLCDPEDHTLPRLREYLRHNNLNPESAEAMVKTWLGNNIEPDMGAFALLKDLDRQGYQCVIASNQDALRAQRLNKWLDDMGLQDVIRFFSCQIGLAKPDRRFYLAIQEALGKGPGDLYLFDDRVDYIEAAMSEGWQGQLVRPDLSPVPP